MKLHSLLILICSILISPMSQAIEEPDYQVIKKYAHFEVRQYANYIVAEVMVNGTSQEAGNLAFKYLGGYIFGKNKGARKIEMTAPVTQVISTKPQENEPLKIAMTAPVTQIANNNGNGYLVQFTMPKKFTMASLPEPIDPKVSLREVPGKRYAVIRYSGSWSDEKYQEKLSLLKKEVNLEGLQTQGEPIFARYNAPFSLPFLRRNEIWIMLVSPN